MQITTWIKAKVNDVKVLRAEREMTSNASIEV